jgi:hypothetical protein
MSVTLSQKKESLKIEAADIEKLIERRHATPEKIKRLEEIEFILKVIEGIEKPDSMAKKAKMEVSQ